MGVLSPSLSSHWVGLVTPVPGALARPLVESLRHDAVAAEHDIAGYVPGPPGGLTGFDDSVRLALQKVSAHSPSESPRHLARGLLPPAPCERSWPSRSCAVVTTACLICQAGQDDDRWHWPQMASVAGPAAQQVLDSLGGSLETASALPSPGLRTHPVTLYCQASRWQVARKLTPCTCPEFSTDGGPHQALREGASFDR